MTEDNLLQEVDVLISFIRTRAPSTIQNIFLATTTSSKVHDLLDACFDLQARILAANNDRVALTRLSNELVKLELRAHELMQPHSIGMTLLMIAAGFSVILVIVQFIDLQAFMSETLGIEAPERMITLGMAGAFLYLSSSILHKRSQANQDSTADALDTTDVLTRLAMAVVVPIILVALVFQKDGSFSQNIFTPELMSFACGYSATLVMDTVNKLVDKVSEMIKAI